MNEPDEDCLQSISNALSYSTPKSYDSLLGYSFLGPNSLPPEQAIADQTTLLAHEASAQSHMDIITEGVTVQPMMSDNITTRTTHRQGLHMLRR